MLYLNQEHDRTNYSSFHVKTVMLIVQASKLGPWRFTSYAWAPVGSSGDSENQATLECD